MEIFISLKQVLFPTWPLCTELSLHPCAQQCLGVTNWLFVDAHTFDCQLIFDICHLSSLCFHSSFHNVPKVPQKLLKIHCLPTSQLHCGSIHKVTGPSIFFPARFNIVPLHLICLPLVHHSLRQITPDQNRAIFIVDNIFLRFVYISRYFYLNF